MWLLVYSCQAVEPFVIEDIRIEGLQRIAAGTVFNYLKLKVGDVFDDRQSASAVRSLFKTGFFDDVRLETTGNELIVVVKERPAIASVKIEGNKDIGSDDLTKALKGIGLSEGKVFDKQSLDKVEQELRRQYYSRGKYGLQIDSKVIDLPRNRVAIEINIKEGRVARIRNINVVGNSAFPDDELLDVFELSTPNLLSFYTKNDQYSKQKLQADLERLRSFYLDRGYLKFEIESTQVSITPNKKEIYIVINVKEGSIYSVEEVKVTGKLIVPPDIITPLVKIGPGQTFSRKLATESSKAISDRLGDDGYIFANVNMIPDINEQSKTAKITFFVDPGKQVYTRRIGFQGNTKTRDEVLRREMRQMEAAWASSTKIERSKARLERLGYFKEVNVETPAVPGTTDQIDINYSVVENTSGNLSAGLGFSQAQGLIFNASVSQDNILGSGKRVNFSFNNSTVNTIYSIGYLNPYSTVDGVSTGFDLTYRDTNATRFNISSYNTTVASAGFNLSLPLNEFDRIRLNLDAAHTTLRTTGRSSNEIRRFIAETDDNTDTTRQNFDSFCATSPAPPAFPPILPSLNCRLTASYTTFTTGLSWSHDTLNRAIFATKGGAQRLAVLAAIPGSDLTYFKASYKQQEFFPISNTLTLLLQGEVAYGDGYGKSNQLPFFENYYSGGIDSVRGFTPNTLGPRDSRRLPLGGNSKLAATAELFFPVPFLKDSRSFRLGAFFDAGNVFNNTFDVGDLRYATGLSARWLSPFGNLAFSVAQPLNSQSGDRLQQFQFSFGSGF